MVLSMLNPQLRQNLMYSLFLLASVSLFQSVSAGAACYYPNGDLNPDDVPCNPSADVSVCCGRGWTCLSNGVCMLGQDSSVGSISRIGSTYRTSCTDRSWNSTACPTFCKASPWNLGVYQAVSSCGQHSWCCQNETANSAYCCTQTSTFDLENVQEKAFTIPLSTSASSSSALPNPTATESDGLSPSFHSKLEIIALSIGLGIPFGLAFGACLFFLARKQYRARRGPQAGDTHNDAEFKEGTWGSTSGSVEMPGNRRAAEMPEYQGYGLHGEKQMPVEISG